MGGNVATNSTANIIKIKRSNQTYSNALTNTKENALTYYRKVPKEASKILAEAVSALWKVRADTIKLLEQTPSEEDYHSKEGRNTLPANQFIMESFLETPLIDSKTSTQMKSETLKRMAKQFRIQVATLQQTKKQYYEHNPRQNTIQTTEHGGIKRTPPAGEAPGAQRRL